MNYDFETVVDRYGTGSYKYDAVVEINPKAAEEKIVPFTVADMEVKTAPEIVDGLKKYVDEKILGYTGPTKEYYDAVINWMEKRHHWTIEKDWIINTPGVVGALFNSVRAYTKPSEGVIVFSPVYYPFYKSIELSERKVVKSSLVELNGKYQIDFVDFEEKAKDPNNKALMFCSPHNPGGRVWTKLELEEIARICQKYDVLILSDEIHFDLIMPGHEHIVFSTINDWVKENSVIFTAPSKSFSLAGLHISNIVIPSVNLREKFQAEMDRLAGMSVNLLGYEATKIAYNESEAWIDQVNELIYHNHLTLKEYLGTHHKAIKVYDLDGTYLQWLDFNPLGLKDEELKVILHEKALFFMTEGQIFGEEGKGFWRLNLACPKRVLVDALKRLTKALN